MTGFALDLEGTAEVGRAAVQQLLRLIRTEKADLLTLLPTELVVRDSTGPAPR